MTAREASWASTGKISVTNKKLPSTYRLKMQSVASKLRNLSKIQQAKLLAGLGAVTGMVVAGSSSKTVYFTKDSYTSAVKQAYEKFMPTMDFPDLSKHNNCLKNHLTPQIYSKLRDLVRKLLHFIRIFSLLNIALLFCVILFSSYSFSLYHNVFLLF